MKSHLLYAAFASVALFCTPALAVSTTAEHFVKTASMSDMFEIESSRLALDKSKNEAVRDFAQAMVDDHGKSSAELKTVLDAHKLDLAPETRLDSKHQKIMDQLRSAEGSDFDKKYVQAQQDGHKEAVEMFSAYANSGANKDLKEFAAKTLPTLEEHKKHVDSLAAK